MPPPCQPFGGAAPNLFTNRMVVWGGGHRTPGLHWSAAKFASERRRRHGWLTVERVLPEAALTFRNYFKRSLEIKAFGLLFISPLGLAAYFEHVGMMPGAHFFRFVFAAAVVAPLLSNKLFSSIAKRFSSLANNIIRLILFGYLVFLILLIRKAILNFSPANYYDSVDLLALCSGIFLVGIGYLGAILGIGAPAPSKDDALHFPSP